MISKNVLGIVVSFAAALCWGLVYAQVQNLDAKLSPIAILSLFYICAAVAMTPFAAFQIPRLTGKLRQNYREFFICLLATITAEIFIFYSIELLGGTDASLIEVSYPLWTGLTLYVFANERPSRTTVLGGLFILAGVALIALDKA